MKKEMTIYTNLSKNIFFEQIFPEYNINFKTIDDNFFENKINDNAIVFYIQRKKNIHIENTSKKLLLFLKNNYDEKIYNKENIFEKLLTPKQLRDQIDKYFSKHKIGFQNIVIEDKRINNLISGKSCYLTDIESEILEYLFKQNKCSRGYIKKNILNIRPVVETNSIDSHLTRIRKKLVSIDAQIIIQTKNDNIIINSHQKIQD